MKRHTYMRSAMIFTLLFLLLITICKVGQTAEQPNIFVQLGHLSDVKSVTFSPDGRFVLSASEDGALKLWDINSGREIRTYSGHSAWVATISPNSQFVLSGSMDGTLKLLDLADGQEIATLRGHDGGVTCVAFSPDGKYIVSGGMDKTIIMWSVHDLKVIRKIQGHTSWVSSVAFSPNGKYILSGSHDRTSKLWNIASGKIVRTFNGHKEKVSSVTFSPDGKHIATGDWNGVIHLWDPLTGKKKRTIKDSWIESLAFSPDGQSVLSGSHDGSLRLWNINNGKKIISFMEHSRPIFSVKISSNGKYAMSGSRDQTIKMWDIATGKIVSDFRGYSTPVASVDINTDSKHLLIGRPGKNIKLWDILSGIVQRNFTNYNAWITSVVFSPDGFHALTGSMADEVKLWEVATGREVRSFKTSSISPNALCFSPDGNYALSGGVDGVMRLWNVETGVEIKTFRGHTQWITSVAFSPDGIHALSGSEDKTVQLWNVASGKLVRTFTGHGDWVTSVAFNRDGRQFISGSRDFSVKLWDVSNGTELYTVRSSDGISFVRFSPDDRYILAGGYYDGTLTVWSSITGEQLHEFMGHTAPITSAIFTPDSKHIISGSNDTTTRIWDIATGKEIAQFISFTDGEWITITPNGYYNASPNGDKHLNVRIGNNVYGIENYREAFFRPDLVKIALSGGSLKEYRNIADVKQPPQVEIVDTPQTVASDELTVKLKLSDTGGGIGDVRLYLNGSAIMLDNSRGLKVVEKESKQGTTRSYKIRLALGDNNIRAVAFNAENSMQSNHAEQTVTATFTQIAKPTLHALVIGVNEFKNPKLHLQYAVPDADLFTETLMKGASDLFGKVNIVRLTTPKQTTSDNITSELNKMHSINPDDMFILFVASHGTVDDGEYFLLTSNVGSTSTAKLKTDALSQERIKVLIANIPATKKVIVLDTCNAGQMGDAIQVAMRTRGMSEDTAFKILSRAVGSTVLSSATSTQEALEGYKGHGLFTWVLVEGMKGKADKGKTGYIKTTDLVDYVESEVPDIAEKHFQRKQYPTTAVSGQGFPIGKAGL